jgi:hypothetical protein
LERRYFLPHITDDTDVILSQITLYDSVDPGFHWNTEKFADPAKSHDLSQVTYPSQVNMPCLKKSLNFVTTVSDEKIQKI